MRSSKARTHASGRGFEFREAASAQQADPGMGVKQAQDFREIVGGQLIVIVDHDQDRGVARLKTPLARRAEPGRGFGDEAQVGGRRGLPVGQAQCRRGGIVHQHRFPFRDGQRLPPQRLQGAREAPLVRVVGAEDDGQLHVS